MKLKADLVLCLVLVGQPRPVDCVLALLNVLFCCAALIVESDDPTRHIKNCTPQANQHNSPVLKDALRDPFTVAQLSNAVLAALV